MEVPCHACGYNLCHWLELPERCPACDADLAPKEDGGMNSPSMVWTRRHSLLWVGFTLNLCVPPLICVTLAATSFCIWLLLAGAATAGWCLSRLLPRRSAFYGKSLLLGAGVLVFQVMIALAAFVAAQFLLTS